MFAYVVPFTHSYTLKVLNFISENITGEPHHFSSPVNTHEGIQETGIGPQELQLETQMVKF